MRNKNTKTKNKIPLIFLLLQLVADALIALAMMMSDMFPMFYIVIVLIVEAMVLIISIVLDFADREDQKRSVIAVRRVVSGMISVMMLAGAIFAFLVVSEVGDTITNITSRKTVTSVVGVYVRANDPAQTIEDAADYNFGYATNYDVANTKDAIIDINKALARQITTTSYEDSVVMVQHLYDSKIDAIILNESYAGIISDQEEYQDFSEKTRLIYEYEVVTKVHKDNKKSDGDLSTFIVYLSGSDTRNKTLDVSRSDVNILMAVNTKTKEIVLINTPRDYYVPISVSKSGTRDKLTHCGIYGIECSMDTLGNLYGQTVDYYAQINFTGLATLIDAVGGVTVNSDYAFSNTHDNPLLDGSSLSVSVGENHLNGAQALAFARERMSVPGGDNARGVNQMKVITALVDKLSVGTILGNYSDILKSLQGMFATDMSQDDINALVKMQLGDMASWNIHSYAVTGSDGSSTTYSMPGTNAYVMYPNQSTVDHASELIEKVLDGKSISDSDVQ